MAVSAQSSNTSNSSAYPGVILNKLPGDCGVNEHAWRAQPQLHGKRSHRCMGMDIPTKIGCLQASAQAYKCDHVQ